MQVIGMHVVVSDEELAFGKWDVLVSKHDKTAYTFGEAVTV